MALTPSLEAITNERKRVHSEASRLEADILQTIIRHAQPRETHFNLQLQLPPVDANKHVYTIREVEAPLTRVVACYNQKTKKVQITQYEEGGASNNIQDTAAIFKDSIYFFLDIP